jgi:hypothetical protein
MKEPSHEEKWSNAPLDPEQAKPGSSTEKDTTVADWLAGEHPHQTRETGSEFDHNSPVFNSKYPGLHLHYVAHGGKPNAYGLVSQLDKQKVRTLSWEAVLGAPRRIYAKLFNSRADKTPKEQAYIESIQVSEKLVNSMFPLITLESATGSRPENSNQETGGYPAHLVYEFISVLSNYQKQTLGNDNIHIFDVNLYDKTARDWIIRIAEDAREFERNKNYHSCYKWLLEFCKFNEYRERSCVRIWTRTTRTRFRTNSLLVHGSARRTLLV